MRYLQFPDLAATIDYPHCVEVVLSIVGTGSRLSPLPCVFLRVTMSEEPTHDRLVQRLRELEKEIERQKRIEARLVQFKTAR
jgi:hypothetical protein